MLDMASPATGTPIAGSATHIRLLAMSAGASKARCYCAAKLAGQSSCLQAGADSAALAVLSDLGGDSDGQLGISSTLVAESGDGANADCMVDGHTGAARVRFASVKCKWLGLGAGSCHMPRQAASSSKSWFPAIRTCMLHACASAWHLLSPGIPAKALVPAEPRPIPPNPHCMPQRHCWLFVHACIT